MRPLAWLIRVSPTVAKSFPIPPWEAAILTGDRHRVSSRTSWRPIRGRMWSGPDSLLKKTLTVTDFGEA